MKRRNLFGHGKLAAIISICLFLIALLPSKNFAQSGGKWATGGNSISSTEFFGTLNNAPIVFKTLNTEKMRLLSNGYLGIGVTDPDAMLHVDGTIRFNSLNGTANGLVVANKFGTLQRISFTGNNRHVLLGDGTFAPYSDDDWLVSGNNMTTIPTGNVGIGVNTFSGNYKLEVGGDVKINGGLTVREITAENGKLVFNNTDLYTDGFLLVDNITSSAGTINFNNSNITTTGSISANNLIFTGIPTFENLTINGLTTTNALNVNENINVSNMLNFTGSTPSIYAQLGDLNIGSSQDIMLSTSSRVTIPEGKLGIGVSNPIELLDVNGNANIRGTLYVQDGVIIGQRIESDLIEAADLIISRKMEVSEDLKAENLEVSGLLTLHQGLSVPNAQMQNLSIDGQHSKITSTGGNINFDDENLNTTGAVSATELLTTNMHVAGKLGIGVTNPVEILDVDGNANIRGTLYVQDGVIIGQRIESELIEAVERINTRELEVETNLRIGELIEFPRAHMQNMSIDGINSTITSTAGSINFDNENLNTTGNITVSNITTTGDVNISGNLNAGSIEIDDVTTGSIYSLGNITSEGTVDADYLIVNNNASVWEIDVTDHINMNNNSLLLSSNTDIYTGVTQNSINTNNADLEIQNQGNYNTILNNNGGNVGIGKSPNGFKLDVLGTGRFGTSETNYVKIGYNSVHSFIDGYDDGNLDNDHKLLINWYSGNDVSVGGGPTAESATGTGTFSTLHATTLSATSGNVTIGSGSHPANLEVKGNLTLNQKDIYLKDNYHGLGYYGNTALTGTSRFASTDIDGPVLFGWSGGALGTKSPNENIALKWDYNGDIAINKLATGADKMVVADANGKLGTADMPDISNLCSAITCNGNNNVNIGNTQAMKINLGQLATSGANNWASNYIGFNLKYDNSTQTWMRENTSWNPYDNGSSAIINSFGGDMYFVTIPNHYNSNQSTFSNDDIFGQEVANDQDNYGKVRMIISKDGNVGIGLKTDMLPSQDANLHIVNTTNMAPTIRLECYNHDNNDAMNYSHNTKWDMVNEQGSFKLSNEYDISDDYGAISHVNYSTRFQINPNGNVGIGTTCPSEKLTVNGKIKVKEEIVIDDAGNWCDYVFDKDYKMLSIPDLEKFIKANNHLPNIPSAKVVETEGLHVMDMNRRMMEKIEELTLYIIDLEKRLKDVENKSSK